MGLPAMGAPKTAEVPMEVPEVVVPVEVPAMGVKSMLSLLCWVAIPSMTSKKVPAMGISKAAEVPMEVPRVNVPVGTPAVGEHNVNVMSSSWKDVPSTRVVELPAMGMSTVES